jgi:NAD+ synthase (glutamine-hydrolysing)
MKQLKVALGQMHVVPGQPTLNFLTIERMVSDAVKARCELIVFPELAITGYLIGDQFLDNEWIDFAVSFNEKIKMLSENIIIVWGNVVTLGDQPTITNNDSRLAKLNAALIAYKKSYVTRKNGLFPGIYPKRLFPNYRIFDDQRYFLPGRELEEKLGLKVKSLLQPFELSINDKIIRFGLEVCEDMWDTAYAFSPSKTYLDQGVDVLINISSSPWTLNKETSRRDVIKNHARVPFVFVNKVGADNNGKNIVLFDGGSMVYDANGQWIAAANEHAKEELLITDLSTMKFHESMIESSVNKLYDMLIAGIRYTDKLLFKHRVPWVVGLSGGLDSAVSSALLVAALGNDRLHAFTLPTTYNRSITIQNAQAIAQALGISFKTIPIQPLVDAFLAIQPNASSLTRENIQSRVRGNVLMNVAADLGGVVLNNGNKVEIALGYTTLYGDTIGALAPLGDLTKLQVIELANYINSFHQHPVIPLNLIPTFSEGVPTFELPPSAELKPDQIDPMKWGYHDWLIDQLLSFPSLAPERFLTMYVEQSFPQTIASLITYYHLDDPNAFLEDLEWVLNLWNRSYFKRVQMPPNIIVSKGAFGYDYREAQMPYERTSKYVSLTQKIRSIKE